MPASFPAVSSERRTTSETKFMLVKLLFSKKWMNESKDQFKIIKGCTFPEAYGLSMWDQPPLGQWDWH